VILDSDLAEIYGGLTKDPKRAVKRNLKRGPTDFLFQLTRDGVILPIEEKLHVPTLPAPDPQVQELFSPVPDARAPAPRRKAVASFKVAMGDLKSPLQGYIVT